MLYTPLSVESFRQVLRIGLGRAILYLEQHDDLPYRSVIQDCCLFYTAYDRDFEGHRADYLFDVLHVTGDPRHYRDVLLRELDTTVSHDDAEQRWRLATCFAADGDPVARHHLLAAFRHHVAAYADQPLPEDRPDPTFAVRVLASCLIELDGSAALVDIAAQLGALPADHRDGDDNLELLACARAVDEATDTVLAGAADQSAPIAAFLAAATQAEADRVPSTRRPNAIAQLSYAALRAHYAASWERAPLPWLRAWGRAAPADDVYAAAVDLLGEQEPRRLVSSLRIFFDRPLPLNYRTLMALMEHPDADVAWAATLALSRVSHAAVRALALELLASPDRQQAGITLWESNFIPADMARIRAAIADTDDDDVLHALGWGVRELLEEHPAAVDVDTLLLLYEKGPCASCRNALVAQLLTIGHLPSQLATECACDSYLDTRSLVADDGDSEIGD